MAEDGNYHKLYYAFKPPAVWIPGVHRSPPLIIYGLAFKIRVDILVNIDNDRMIGIFLECTREGSDDQPSSWSCSLTDWILRVIGKETVDTVKIRSTNPYSFNNKRGRSGSGDGRRNFNFVDWGDLIGPKFLQDGYVHIEILFKVDPPVGLDLTEEKLESAGKTNVTSDLLGLYESGEGSDIILKSRDGLEFNCHRLILSARAPFFKAMFQHETKEKMEGMVTMDMDGRSLSRFCKYLYSGKVHAADDKDTGKQVQGDLEMWKELVKAGDMYELDDLSKLAAHALVLRKTRSNAWEIMTFLKLFREEKLGDSLKEIKQFVIQNVKEIVDE